VNEDKSDVTGESACTEERFHAWTNITRCQCGVTSLQLVAATPGHPGPFQGRTAAATVSGDDSLDGATAVT